MRLALAILGILIVGYLAPLSLPLSALIFITRRLGAEGVLQDQRSSIRVDITFWVGYFVNGDFWHVYKYCVVEVVYNKFIMY